MPREACKRKPPVDYTSRDYWSGIAKMSLSKFFILAVLHERPMHGYEVARIVAKTTEGCCTPTEGTIYPALREFEEGGYVTCRAETVNGRERRIYTLTERGREAFEVALEVWMEAVKALGEARVAVDRNGPAEERVC